MKKKSKSKGKEVSAAAGQDIVGLLTTLVEKLTSFEAKLDTVLSRLPAAPVTAPIQQPVPAAHPQQHRDPRTVFKAVCADCGKGCEVPFRPSGDRPVYCRECFRARKNSTPFKPQQDSRRHERPPMNTRPPERPQPAEPVKPAKKKPSAKKKK